MVKTFIRIAYIALMAVFAILLCVNCIRALNSGYEKTEFTVTHMYTNHTTKTNEVSLQAEIDDTLIIPANKLVTGRDYEIGEQLVVWYHPEQNVVVQNFMTNIVLKFTCAGLAVLCIVFAFPRKKVSDAKS